MLVDGSEMTVGWWSGRYDAAGGGFSLLFFFPLFFSFFEGPLRVPAFLIFLIIVCAFLILIIYVH